MRLEAIENSTQVRIDTGHDAIGPLQLWMPEGIAGDRGFSSVYPRGTWSGDARRLTQHVGPDDLFGGGNFPRIDERTLECAGIRIPVDEPVEWNATVTAGAGHVEFSVVLRNLGTNWIFQAGAPVCVKFLHAPWWSDASTFVASGGNVRSLADLGRRAGMDNGFQAYLLRGQSFDNIFYREFWGFNQCRLHVPVMVSEHREAGLCVGVTSPRAYFLHSNPGNPCTDIMLAFGNVAPGAVAVAEGLVLVRNGGFQAILGAEEPAG